MSGKKHKRRRSQMAKRKLKDIEIGRKFGKWTVLDWLDSRNVHVVCECGNQRFREACSLRGGHTSSCGGCLKDLNVDDIGQAYFINCLREVLELEPLKSTRLHPESWNAPSGSEPRSASQAAH
jgi:hypothetical protein